MNKKYKKIPENVRNPPTIDIRPTEIEQLDNFFQNLVDPTKNDKIQIILSKRQLKLLRITLSTFLWIINLLSVKRAGIGIIRKVLKIPIAPPPEKKVPKDHSSADHLDDQNTQTGSDTEDHFDNDSNDNNNDDNDNNNDDNDNNNDDNDNDNDDDNDDNDDEKDDPSQESKKPEDRPNHNGRRASDDLEDITISKHFHDKIKSGDPCLEIDCKGRLYTFYRDGKPREIITFDFTPPIRPTVHQIYDLRCNICLKVYKAPLSPELIKNGALEKGRYLYTAQAALAILHYGMGMPMYRLDQFQSMTGERFPESTQFDQLEILANTFKCLTDAMINSAADAPMIQGDDVANRVLSLTPELRERRSDNKIVHREGIHSSLLIATTSDGHLIPVLKTGIIHFGELLDEVLLLRSSDLPGPFLVCDGSKVNKTYVNDSIVGGCWEHAREYFVKAKKNFPDEASVIVEMIKEIFKIDRETHGMGGNERLEHLIKHGLPVVKNIKFLVDQYSNDQVALPKSELGVAIQYFQNQYSRFLVPFTYAGVPIHNNISEWCTYLVVRLTANSKFYLTEAGAVIGDKIMMILLFCYLSLINPYDFIVYCLQNKEEMKKEPHNFFPWRLKGKVKSLHERKQMKFWAPPPPE